MERTGVSQNMAYIQVQTTIEIMVTASAAAPADGRRLHATPAIINEILPDTNNRSEYVRFTNFPTLQKLPVLTNSPLEL